MPCYISQADVAVMTGGSTPSGPINLDALDQYLCPTTPLMTVWAFPDLEVSDRRGRGTRVDPA